MGEQVLTAGDIFQFCIAMVIVCMTVDLCRYRHDRQRDALKRATGDE
jgi:hypothetical protein